MTIGTYSSSTSSAQLGLDPRRIYSIINKDSTDSIYLGIGRTVAADGADGDNKYILTPNECVDIGPGETFLNYKSSANTPKLGISSVVAEASVLAAVGVS